MTRHLASWARLLIAGSAPYTQRSASSSTERSGSGQGVSHAYPRLRFGWLWSLSSVVADARESAQLGSGSVVLILAVLVAGLAGVARGQVTITEFTIATGDSAPSGIAAGPDGALWFTENRGTKIGRITTAGIVTEFPVPRLLA